MIHPINAAAKNAPASHQPTTIQKIAPREEAVIRTEGSGSSDDELGDAIVPPSAASSAIVIAKAIIKHHPSVRAILVMTGA